MYVDFSQHPKKYTLYIKTDIYREEYNQKRLVLCLEKQHTHLPKHLSHQPVFMSLLESFNIKCTLHALDILGRALSPQQFAFSIASTTDYFLNAFFH